MINGAKETLEIIAFHRSMTFEERRAWAYSKKDEWDLYAVTETAEKRGRAEGMAEGREKEKLENARNLKRLGVDSAIIAEALGLTADEVAEA